MLMFASSGAILLTLATIPVIVSMGIAVRRCAGFVERREEREAAHRERVRQFHIDQQQRARARAERERIERDAFAEHDERVEHNANEWDEYDSESTESDDYENYPDDY
jgi:hypothetical protein